MISINPSPKGYILDQDKAFAPEKTVEKAQKALESGGCDILQELARVDSGRLGIPVYMSVCTAKAGKILPASKQMGKGASPEQAKASALMELAERYSFFSFWENKGHKMTWSEAEEKFPGRIMPLELIAACTGENIAPEKIRQIMDLIPWRFEACTNLYSGREYYAPVDWFRMLNEFNGSSAGNTTMESILQGTCELVERHVCARISAANTTVPTIDPCTLDSGPLEQLLSKFTRNGIQILLKDFTLGMPVPTVGVAAYDPKTFPDKSDIVFTAGTATSPEKAAIRALTETAQLAGDFESGKPYEPSGLPKPTSLEDLHWLQQGEKISLNRLPDISAPDFGRELEHLTQSLGKEGFYLHVLDLTCPEIGMPAHYNFVPGFDFRERSPSASIGMFTAKRIAQELPPEKAGKSLDKLSRLCPGAPYLPFQYGIIALEEGNPEGAHDCFRDAAHQQKDSQEKAMALFYAGYVQSLCGHWEETKNYMRQAIELDAEVKEYHNLLGVSLFKQENFRDAATHFREALKLDSASAVDMANLGLCHKKMGNKEEAVSYLVAGLEIDPSLEFAHKELLGLL
jgi:ribosomal protein S12 methylthiotransferase accessory factor